MDTAASSIPPRAPPARFQETSSDVRYDDAVGARRLIWSPYRETGGRSLFPPVPVAAPDTPTAPLDAARAFPPPLDDTNRRWI
ncbi:hypothetical protein ACNFR7_09930 [Streptomyces sp. RM1]